MILLIWGTTIFLPELEKFYDLSILLELSEKNRAKQLEVEIKNGVAYKKMYTHTVFN